MTTAPIPSPERVRDYILRRLPDDERGRFEEAYFGDDNLLELVEDEEDRLVSDYVLGRLPQEDRRRFEEALLGSPYYRRRVETTGGIRVDLAQFPARPPASVPSSAPPDAARVLRPRDLPGRHRVTLLPGKTGTGVAFVLLFCLLVAAVLSAWTLRRDLVALRRRVAAAGLSAAVGATGARGDTGAAGAAGAAGPSGASGASGAPAPLVPPGTPDAGTPAARPGPAEAPRAAFLLLDDPGLDGPPARRLPAAGGAVVLVVPSYRLPADSRGATFVLVDESGRTAWRSGEVPRSEQAAGGVVAQLPAGLPASGRGALFLVPGPESEPQRLLAVLIRDEPGN